MNMNLGMLTLTVDQLLRIAHRARYANECERVGRKGRGGSVPTAPSKRSRNAVTEIY